MMVSSCQETILIWDEAVVVAIIFIFDDGDFEFGGKIRYKFVDEKPGLHIIIFKIDFDIFEMVAATWDYELANLVHFTSGDIFSHNVVPILWEVFNHGRNLNKVPSDSVENVPGFYVFVFNL